MTDNSSHSSVSSPKSGNTSHSTSPKETPALMNGIPQNYSADKKKSNNDQKKKQPANNNNKKRFHGKNP